MESKIHQNAILTGYVDAYCLICENSLRIEDIFNHINKPIHKKNLDAAPYVKKYKGEYIRKVKKGYYCEFCNILFSTVTKVNLHIAQATHIQNKGAPVVKRVGNSLIALNDVYINERAWNGLIEDICALCDLEFYNENTHKAEQNHILNLIQKKVQFVDKKAVYRMVDNESFQCLTCNMIFAVSAIETHFNENNHKSMFQKCRENQFEPATIVQQSNEEALKKLDIHVQDFVKNANVNDTSKEIPNKSTLKTPNTQQTEQKSGNNNKKTNRSEPKQTTKTNVNATLKMEEAMGYVMKPNFDQNHNDTVKYWTTGEEAQNISLNILDVPKNSNQTLATSTPTESQTSSRREINDEKALKIHNVQKVVKSAKPNDTLNEVPKKSTLETFNPNQMENKPDKNKNTKTTTSELKYETKTNVNATAKTKEAVGHALKTNFDQSRNETDKSQPTSEEEKTENATQNLSEVPKNFNQTLAVNTPTESKKETSSRREINDEKALKINHVQKVVKSAKPNDMLKEDPKKSILDTSNPNQTEKKPDENKNNNTKINTSEPKYVSKTNVNATAKMEEAVGHVMNTTFDQNHSGTDKNQPLREEEKAEDAIQNLSEVPKNLNQSLAAYSPTGNPKETSSRKEINDQAEFAYEHNLTYNEGIGNAFCRLCNVRLPAHLKSMKEHVNGTNHTNKVKLKQVNTAKNKKDNLPKKTIPTDKFLREIHTIRTRHGEHVILNNKFFLTLLSYSMITNNMNRLRCQACEVNLPDGIEQHLDSSTHESTIDKIPVVQKLNGEFVREVRPGLFHCGFCNLIVGVWENVSVHLQCGDHVKNKILAGRYLREYLPQVLEAQWQRQLDFNLLLASMSSHYRQRETYSRFMRGNMF